MNMYKDDLVLYWNFVNDNKGTIYSRKHYTLIDLWLDIGGVTNILFLLAFFVLKPFIYKRNELAAFKDQVKNKKAESSDD